MSLWKKLLQRKSSQVTRDSAAKLAARHAKPSHASGQEDPIDPILVIVTLRNLPVVDKSSTLEEVRKGDP